MKFNGKKLGVGGTIVVVILYLLLAKAGLISPENADTNAGNNVAQHTTEAPAVTKAPKVTEVPAQESKATEAPTEVPEVTEVPETTKAPEATEAPTWEPVATEEPEIELTDYGFRSKKLRDSHFEKHGIEMGFETVEDYIEAANKVISNPDALHKLEAEDNDHIYFIEATNEFVVLSQDGYIRTYYIANGGIDYYNRQ